MPGDTDAFDLSHYSDPPRFGTGMAVPGLRRHIDGLGGNTVRLWDADTGAQLQMLDLSITTRTRSFSTSGQYLKTDRGVLHVSSLESFTDSSEQVRPLFVSDD
jgi:hypothetical protein